AEASVIREKSIAEVEAIEKRGEALNKNKEVMLTEMIINMAPEFAKSVSEPLGKVESIRILDSGDGKQMNSLPKTVTNTISNLQESLGQMTGIDLEHILENLSDKIPKTKVALLRLELPTQILRAQQKIRTTWKMSRV